MLRLPALSVETAVWHLPLPDRAALMVLAALFTAEGRERLQLLTQTLKEHPSFLLWIVCRDSAWREEPPEAIREVATRLSAAGPGMLQGSELPQPDEPGSTISAKRWEWLTVRSLSVAERAATLAASEPVSPSSPRRLAGQAFLLGLLHAAPDWLSSCGPTVRFHRGSSRLSPLPGWLAETLRQIHQGGPVGGVAGCVAAAMLQRPADRPTDPSLESSPLRPREPRQEPLHAQLASLLPRIVGKLRRLEELETEFRSALEREKLESLRQLAYGASHEINNPLANISTRAQTLLREETNPERRRKLATINAQAFRAHEMISDMMLFAKPPELDPGPVDAVKLVTEVVEELRYQATEQHTALSVKVGNARSVMLNADRVQLGVALKSLCVNSLEALGAGGVVEVSVQAVPMSREHGEPWIEISVSDTGPGISADARRHLFDPFFSGREAGRGLGLGLSKCWRIVTLHGGRIKVDSSLGRGATFTICLPQGTAPPIAAGRPVDAQ